MDYIDYRPPSIATASSFPAVSASSSSPKTLYQAHTYITYVNIGSGWVPLSQGSSGSVYAVLDPATKQNVLSNLANTVSTGSQANVVSSNVLGHH